MVVSGAAIQAVKSTDGNSYTKQAADFKSSDTTDASANWVALLDATGTSDEKSSQKPKNPTGWRNVTGSGALNTSRKLGTNGIPDPSQINKNGKWYNANKSEVDDNGGTATSNVYDGDMD